LSLLPPSEQSLPRTFVSSLSTAESVKPLHSATSLSDFFSLIGSGK
jgi:hypothetical protein